METLTTSINDAACLLGIGRTKVYELVAQGSLRTIKIGRRTLVVASSIKELVDIPESPRILGS